MTNTADIPQDSTDASGRLLRQAYNSLVSANRVTATHNGERTARVIEQQFDTALQAVEALIVLRAGDQARTAARYEVTGSKDQG